MSEIKWIKITTSMFDDDKIKIIESMPDGDTILVIWVKLLIQAMRTFSKSETLEEAGYVYLSQEVPYSEDMLATIFDRQLNTVKLALATFQKLQMIEIEETGKIFIPRFIEHQNIDQVFTIREQARNRMRRFRSKKQPLLATKDDNVTHLLRNGYATVTQEKEKETIDIEKDLCTNNISTIDNNKVLSTNISTKEIENGENSHFPSINPSFSFFKLSLNKGDNPVAVLCDAFKKWHSDAPPEDFEALGDRIAGIAKTVSKDYGYILKLMWDSCSTSITGSHLNYIQGIIREKKKRQRDAELRHHLRDRDPERFVKGDKQRLVQR